MNSSVADAAAAIISQYARKLLGDVAEATVNKASEAHPLLESLATEMIGQVFTDETLAKLTTTIEHLLRELLGDDWPVQVNAQQVVIEDLRDKDPDIPTD